ncbi:Yim1 protein [Candida orthopsilosis Co 90-125]|uniref:Yim1 protein n=1 Tax=Candida orthopsilosis (strain 90-125) TaxID=1136231 RepID=H8WXE2_CANO9|nr:Yim1 protein [Candida orthopsilosis Co 90-125]CCG21448.1 Yim1 protein [Candida orthopsilosis Co 90-125]
MSLSQPKLTYKAYAYKNGNNPIKVVEETIDLVKNPSGQGYIAPPGKILLKINYASLNPVDYKLYKVKPSFIGLFNSKQGFGRDFGGEVLSIGEGTKTNLKIGDYAEGIYTPMFSKGSAAEYLLVDPKNSPITNKPANIDVAQASSFPLVLGTAMQMCSRGGIKFPQSKVLVIGAGTSVGRYAVQLARNGGAKEVVTTNSARTSDLIQSLGATSQIDYRKNPNLLTPVLESVKSTGQFDYIIDCWGGSDLFPEINTILRKGGVYNTIVGDAPGTGLAALLGGAKSVTRTIGSKLGFLNYTYELMLLDNNAGWIDEARDLVGNGEVKIFIDSIWPFDQLNEAIEKLESGTAQGKIVLEVSKSSSSSSNTSTSEAGSVNGSNTNPFK